MSVHVPVGQRRIKEFYRAARETERRCCIVIGVMCTQMIACVVTVFKPNHYLFVDSLTIGNGSNGSSELKKTISH